MRAAARTEINDPEAPGPNRMMIRACQPVPGPEPVINSNQQPHFPLRTSGHSHARSREFREILRNDRTAGSGTNPRTRRSSRFAGQKLLQTNCRTGLFESDLGLFGIFLASAFKDRLGGTLHQVLRFAQTQIGHRADGLDDLQLLIASCL